MTEIMRRNAVTYRTTADDARLNDAFRKTLLQAARNLTDHGKQLLPRALFSNVKFFMKRRELWEIICCRGGGGGKVNSVKSTCVFCLFVFCLLQPVRVFFFVLKT